MLFGTHTHKMLPVSRLKEYYMRFSVVWGFSSFFFKEVPYCCRRKFKKITLNVFVRVQITCRTIVLTLKNTSKWYIITETKTLAFC